MLMSESVLKKIVNHLRIRFPIAELSRELDYSKGVVSQYYNGKKEMSENFKELLENKYKINVQEFEELSGSNMVKTVINDNGMVAYGLPVTEEAKTKYKSEGRIIKKEDLPSKEVYVIPIKGRGGLENAMFDEVMFKDLKTEKLTIKQPASNGSKYFKIEVEGISMDDGSKRSLSEGDWAYCRSIGKQYWKSKFHTHKYDIFCFFHNERGIIFKKIKEQNLETGELLLCSLHEDKKRFPDFTIKVSECSYICNVIKVLSEF